MNKYKLNEEIFVLKGRQIVVRKIVEITTQQNVFGFSVVYKLSDGSLEKEEDCFRTKEELLASL